MKKLTALILTLSMLLSMLVLPMGATATEITEAERKTILSTPDYQYVDFSDVAEADLFAAFSDLGKYAPFQNPASGNTSSAKNATHIFIPDGETEAVTIYDWLPISTDVEFGSVAFYKKGFKTPSELVAPEGVYMLDDLLDENGSTVSTDVYATQKWTSKDVKNNVAKATSASRTVKSLHVVETVEESNGTYAVIKNGNVRHKIGPLSKNEVKNNAFYTSENTDILYRLYKRHRLCRKICSC